MGKTSKPSLAIKATPRSQSQNNTSQVNSNSDDDDDEGRSRSFKSKRYKAAANPSENSASRPHADSKDGISDTEPAGDGSVSGAQAAMSQVPKSKRAGASYLDEVLAQKAKKRKKKRKRHGKDETGEIRH